MVMGVVLGASAPSSGVRGVSFEALTGRLFLSLLLLGALVKRVFVHDPEPATTVGRH